MQPSKWDLILSARPVPIIGHLLEEVSKLFAADLARWPPQIDAFDPLTGGKLAALLADSPQAPHPRLFAHAFTLTRFELERDLAASDDFLRNERWLETGLTAKDKAMLLFLSRFMAEQLWGLAEATAGKLTRAHLLDVLGRTERHFFSRGLLP